MKKHGFRWISMICILMVLFVLVPHADAAGETVEDVIIQAFIDEVDRVDISGFCLTLDEVREIFYGLKYTGQLPWYASNFCYNYNIRTGYVTWFWPNCMNKESYDRNLYEQTVAEILAETVYPGMSQWQIALSIHDYLVAHFDYDESQSLRTGYDLMVNGTAVCAGYAYAYMDLMNRVGIPCHYVLSDGMNHAWNIVQIGGNWYHVDATWDDPTSDIEGRVMHNFFLISDQTISDKNHEHYGWNAEYACTDTSFDKNVFWQDSDCQIIYTSADDCYIRYREDKTYFIDHRDSVTGKHTRLRKVTIGYVNIGKGRYHYWNYGLNIWDGKIYYSFLETVRCRNLDGTGEEETIYKISASKIKKCIVGSVVEDGILILNLRDADGNYYEEYISLRDSDYHSHSYTQTVVPATCQRAGYTLHSCSCGITYTTDPTPVGEHNYIKTVVTPATKAKSGVARFTCSDCGRSFTQSIPRISR